MIDWTKPVHDPKEPYRTWTVLATSRPNPDRPIVVMRDDGQIFTVGQDGIGNPQGYAGGTYGRITLRNVAPPKPEPVLQERWVNLYNDGAVTVHQFSEDLAASFVRLEETESRKLSETRRIVWNSDGSPVEGDKISPLSEQILINDLRAERDAWMSKADEALRLLTEANTRRDQDIALIERLEADIPLKWLPIQEDLRREIERAGPLVSEALAWYGGKPGDGLRRACRDFLGHQNAEPEKSCENCANGPKFSIKCAAKICASEVGYGDVSFANWEPRR